MNVLILATDIYNRGGIARYTATLASALGRLLGRDHVGVLALLDIGEPGDNVTGEYSVLTTISSKTNLASKLRFTAQAVNLGRNKYDLVICSHVSLAPVAAVLKTIYRSKFWVVCHGAEVWHKLLRGERIALKGADAILPVSTYTADAVCRLNDISRSKCKVVYNAIPDSLVSLLTGSGPLPGIQQTSVTQKTLLSVGSLARAHAYKGFDTVIEALPTIVQRCPDVKYVIVGSGDDRQRLEQIAAANEVIQHVQFAGSVSDEHLAWLYRTCDIFVLPSKAIQHNGGSDGEGFGRVYIEAALAGKPVIGSNEGGAAEAVLHGETGLLVNPRSSPDIARVILEVLTSPGLASRLGRAGREWSHRTFTVDGMCVTLADLLRGHATNADSDAASNVARCSSRYSR